MIEMQSLDHLVLTALDVNRTLDFYAHALGKTALSFGAGRSALGFGQQKINLHEVGREFEPRAHSPTLSSADLCFLTATPLEELLIHLNALGVILVAGPIERTGARRRLSSVYLRDPDGNLIEVSNELEGP